MNKFNLNKLATLDMTNSSLETAICDPMEMLGMLNLRSIGCYKIKQGILQQNLSSLNIIDLISLYYIIAF